MYKILKIKKISIGVLLIFLVFYGYYRKTRSLDILHRLTLFSQIGTVEQGNKITAAEGKEGFLVYGPYLPMQEGSFAINYKLLLANLNPAENPEKIVGCCDVNVVDNPQYNVRYDLKIKDFLQKNPHDVVLKFFIPQNMPKVEFRVFQNRGQNISVQSLCLSPTLRYVFTIAKRFIKPNFFYLIIGLPLLFLMFWGGHKFFHITLSWAVIIFLSIVAVQYVWLNITSSQNLLKGAYALSTQIGVRDQVKRQFTGQSAENGFLVYGPYMPLNEGAYKINYRLSFDNREGNRNQALGFCDINVVDSPQNNVRVELTRDIFEKRNPSEITLKFTIPKGTHRTEFRVFQYGGNVLTLKGLSLNSATFTDVISLNRHRFFQNMMYMCGALLLVSLYLKFILMSKDRKIRKQYLYSTLLSIVSGLILAWIWRYKGYTIRQFHEYYDMWQVFYAPVWLPLVFIFFNFLYLINEYCGFTNELEKYKKYDLYTLAVFPLIIIAALVYKNFNSHFVLGNFYLGILVIKSVIYFRFFWQNLKHRQKVEDDRNLKVLFFISIFTVYMLITPWVNAAFYTDGDETVYLLQAQSQILDGDMDIGNNVQQNDNLPYHPDVRWRTDWKGRLVSHISAYIFLPGYLLGGRFGAVVTMNLLAALLAINLFLLFRYLTGTPVMSAGITLLGMFTPPLGIYSLIVYPEMPAALFTLLAVRQLITADFAENPVRKYLFFLLPIVFLFILKERFAIIAVSISLLFLYRLRKNFRLFLPAVVSLLFLLILFVVFDKINNNFVTTGRIMRGINQYLGMMRNVPRGFHGSMGILFDQETGLFVNNPFYFFSFLGMLAMFLRAKKKELLQILAIVAPYFLLISYFDIWSPEGSPAPRYVVAIMPLMLVLSGYYFISEKSRLMKKIVLLAAGCGFFMFYVQILVPQYRVHSPNNVTGENEILSRLFAVGLPRLSYYLPSFRFISDTTYILTFFYLFLLLFLALGFYRRVCAIGGGVERSKYKFVPLLFIALLSLFYPLLDFKWQELPAAGCYSGGGEYQEDHVKLCGRGFFVLAKSSLKKGERIKIRLLARADYVKGIGWPVIEITKDGRMGKRKVGSIKVNNVGWDTYELSWTGDDRETAIFIFSHSNFEEGMNLYVKKIFFLQNEERPERAYLDSLLAKIEGKLGLKRFAGIRRSMAEEAGYVIDRKG